MTEPTQPGPYAGQPGPYTGQPAPPPQGGSYPYASTPPPGYGRPTGPPTDPAAGSDRVSGVLLVLGAVLAVAASFTTMDKSVQYLDRSSEQSVYESVATAWSYSNSQPGAETTSVTQFSGIPLLLGALVALVAAIVLLAAFGRRLPLTRALGIAGATLLFGTVLAVLTDVINDAQWDTDTRTTTFGPGFYLLTVACLLAFAATVLTVLGTRRPVGPAQPQAQQPWQTAPTPQPYPPAQPPLPPQSPPQSPSQAPPQPPTVG
ncbi:hypothetical protein [Streptomyces graminofaciens]|nr:hypothetical protein [Streptomyces graminofaciens]